jgi:hypothetical protein
MLLPARVQGFRAPHTAMSTCHLPLRSPTRTGRLDDIQKPHLCRPKAGVIISERLPPFWRSGLEDTASELQLVQRGDALGYHGGCYGGIYDGFHFRCHDACRSGHCPPVCRALTPGFPLPIRIFVGHDVPRFRVRGEPGHDGPGAGRVL